MFTITEPTMTAFTRTSIFKYPLIAFTGYARAGKDEAAKILIDNGYTRRCFGDIIKEQLRPLCKEHMGIDTFTENNTDKNRIRGLLELWGDVNYADVFNEFFANLPDMCVNTRLVRVREAIAWKERGGIILNVTRATIRPSSQWEFDRLAELQSAGLIDQNVVNHGTISQLHDQILHIARGS